MHANNLHIIQKPVVEIEFQQPVDAMGLQNEITDVFYENIQPKMEALFDELFGENEYASVDVLEIDCGIITASNWQQALAEEISRKLKAALLQVNKRKTDTEEREAECAAESFLFFLQNGFLPWNSRVGNLTELEQLIIIDNAKIATFKTLMVAHPKVAMRLVNQFSDRFVATVLKAMGKMEADKHFALSSTLDQLALVELPEKAINIALLEAYAANNETLAVQQFHQVLLNNTKDDACAKARLEKWLRDESGRGEEMKDDQPKKLPNIEEHKDNNVNKPEAAEDAIYIANAGLVLLHPFLPLLLDAVQLTRDNIWMDENAPHTAVQVLAYLATGNEMCEESDTVLNKILCGTNPVDVLERNEPLNEATKNECDALLREVIGHWRILKNTSIDGLREGFLQRNGKLSTVQDGWRLQVEQRTIDILLPHLPWGIGIIRLPWMKVTLYVEWT